MRGGARPSLLVSEFADYNYNRRVARSLAVHGPRPWRARPFGQQHLVHGGFLARRAAWERLPGLAGIRAGVRSWPEPHR